MMQAIAEVDAGACGFQTKVVASSEDGMFVTLEVTSDCEKIRAFAGALAAAGPVNAYEEISPASESVILSTARECLSGCCAGCITPVGVFKSMQVAAGLALPKDIAVAMRKG